MFTAAVRIDYNVKIGQTGEFGAGSKRPLSKKIGFTLLRQMNTPSLFSAP